MPEENNVRLSLVTYVLCGILIIAGAGFIFFNSDTQSGVANWRTYPYTIPGTELTFPDAEGDQGTDTMWISLGLRLEVVETGDEMWIVVLYARTDRHAFIIAGEEREEMTHRGRMVLHPSKMDMSFTAASGINDTMRHRGQSAFVYDYYFTFTTSEGSTYSFELILTSNKPPATMYDGRVDLGEGHYYLYALTSCTVEGRMEFDEERNTTTHEIVGTSWIEKQWGSTEGMGWDWFSAWDKDVGFEIEIVDLYAGQERLSYMFYVDPGGSTRTYDDILVTVEDVAEGFGSMWRITSEEHDIQLQITLDESVAFRSRGYVFGVGYINGTVLGIPINLETYLELTVPR